MQWCSEVLRKSPINTHIAKKLISLKDKRMRAYDVLRNGFGVDVVKTFAEIFGCCKGSSNVARIERLISALNIYYMIVIIQNVTV